MLYQILKDTQVSPDVGQKEQNAKIVNILFGLSTQKHITSADLQITQEERLRTLKLHRQVANFLKVNNMTDVIKDFKEWYAKLPAPYKEDFMNSPALGEWAAKGFNAGHRACQQLNDKRIADLLAVIERKDAAINAMLKVAYALPPTTEAEHAIRSREVHDATEGLKEALAISPESVELVEVGKIAHDIIEWHLDGCTKEVLQSNLYIVKQKG